MIPVTETGPLISPDTSPPELPELPELHHLILERVHASTYRHLKLCPMVPIRKVWVAMGVKRCESEGSSGGKGTTGSLETL